MDISKDLLCSPKCQHCGGTSISFDLIYGPTPSHNVSDAEHTLARKRESWDAERVTAENAIKEKYQRLLEIVKERLAAELQNLEGSESVGQSDALNDSERLASRQSKIAAKKAYAKLEVEGIQNSFKNEMKQHDEKWEPRLAKVRAASQKIAVVFCRTCGAVCGVALPPLDRTEEANRITLGLQAVVDALGSLQESLVSGLAALGGEMKGVKTNVSSLNARDANREQAKNIQEAAARFRDAFGG